MRVPEDFERLFCVWRGFESWKKPNGSGPLVFRLTFIFERLWFLPLSVPALWALRSLAAFWAFLYMMFSSLRVACSSARFVLYSLIFCLL